MIERSGLAAAAWLASATPPHPVPPDDGRTDDKAVTYGEAWVYASGAFIDGYDAAISAMGLAEMRAEIAGLEAVSIKFAGLDACTRPHKPTLDAVLAILDKHLGKEA